MSAGRSLEHGGPCALDGPAPWRLSATPLKATPCHGAKRTNSTETGWGSVVVWVGGVGSLDLYVVHVANNEP